MYMHVDMSCVFVLKKQHMPVSHVDMYNVLVLKNPVSQLFNFFIWLTACLPGQVRKLPETCVLYVGFYPWVNSCFLRPL